MSDQLEELLNTLLDVTSAFGLPIKLVCFCVILWRTPKSMRYTSYFILNEMFWNFLGNVMGSVGHPYPLIPVLCFRLNGMIAGLLTSESQRHLFFCFIVESAMNCGIGLITTFQFRYMVLAHGTKLAHIHKGWGYVYCASLHVLGSASLFYLMNAWAVPVEDYPEPLHLDNYDHLYCFHPDGPPATIFLCFGFVYFFVCVLLLIIFASMCVLELKRQEKFMQKATLAAQRTLLRNLILMTAVPVFLGGGPLTIAIFFTYYHKIPYARQIVVFSYVVVANHGTAYGILTLCLFSSYRRAVKEIVYWPVLTLNRFLPKKWQVHSQTWAIKVTAAS